MSLVRVQSEEPNLKSLLLKQAFCFSAFVKLSGGGFALPTYEIPGRVSGMRDVSLLSAERWLIEGAQLAGMQFVALCTQ